MSSSLSFTQKKRVREHNVNEQFLHRWSRRSFLDKAISQETLMQLFEAARWAPSSYNNQPWRFIYALRETDAWQPLFNLLVPFNQEWVKRAGALVLVIAHKNFDFNGKPSRTCAFDAGAAWFSLALQASLIEGLSARGMEGFDYDRAREVCKVPEDHEVLAMIAVGYYGPLSLLSDEMQKQEFPSERKALTELIFEGSFGNKRD